MKKRIVALMLALVLALSTNVDYSYAADELQAVTDVTESETAAETVQKDETEVSEESVSKTSLVESENAVEQTESQEASAETESKNNNGMAEKAESDTDTSADSESEELILAASTDNIASGTCGDTATWVLDNEYCLTISGTGKMDDYSWTSYSSLSGGFEDLTVPWADYITQISQIVIENGITYIGNNAFTGTTALDSITFPNTVTETGSDIFYKSSIKRVTFPESLITLGNYVFEDCPQLEYVYLPASLRSINSSFCGDCPNLSDIDISSDNQNFCIDNGSMYDVNKTVLWKCLINQEGIVDIPDTVTTIKTYAFAWCSKLTEIRIPSNVTSLGSNTFQYCTSLEKVILDENTTISSIPNRLFYNCSSLQEFNIPTTVQTVGNYAFYGCSNLENIVFPDSVTAIRDFALAKCKSLKKVILPNNLTQLSPNLFLGDEGLCHVDIPETVTKIRIDAFNHCTSLKNIVVPASVTTIASSSFSYCSEIKTILFEGDAPSFADQVFYQNSGLTIYYPANNDTWTTDVMKNYGAKDDVTWISYTEADLNITGKNIDGNYVMPKEFNSTAWAPSISVSDNATLYYSSTGNELNFYNYLEEGTTTPPTRTISGTSKIYWIAVPKLNARADTCITHYCLLSVCPKVTVNDYSGKADGAEHTITAEVEGDATIYYSTSDGMYIGNYKTYGSTTKPSRSTEGTTTVYWFAVPNNDATGESCSRGTATITLTSSQETSVMQVTAADKTVTYNGSAQSVTLTVSGPSSYTTYYSTSTQLTSSNYTTGTTTVPTRTNSGTTTVYYYVKSGDSSYTDASGSYKIHIQPKVTTSNYSGYVDGSAHSATISASGTASLYFSTSTALTYSNYASSGSTTKPTRSTAGTTTVYWIAVPGSNASSDSCVTGTASISLTAVQVTQVSTTSLTFTYDGSAHPVTLAVSGPASYTAYYSTSTQLTSSNYTSGSTTAPTRINSGTTTVYYYVKPSTAAYSAAAGSVKLNVKPKASVTAYSGAVDGSSHSITPSVTGGATMYYSTSTALTYSNYASSGTTTKPSRSTAGTTTVYWIAVPDSDATSDNCVSGTSTIVLNSVSTTTVTAADKTVTYNGSAQSVTLTVSGPSSYTTYYSTSTQLTSSNYTTGTTTVPTRTNSGTTTVYYYVKSGNSSYSDASGSYKIHIQPKVTTSDYTGYVDGSAHSATISASGTATLYYSTEAALTYSNYATSGTTTKPTRSTAGTTTVYWIAVPGSNASSNSCITGTAKITLTAVQTTQVNTTASTYTYDGSSHPVALSVRGPASYTVYYSTGTQLTSSNYTNGSTTAPTRINSGTTTVYYYVKSLTDAYSDASGSVKLNVKPKASVTAYSGLMDGTSYTVGSSVSGSATMYYSTSTTLTYSNYDSDGTMTKPTRSTAGTTTVYWIAVPDSDATADSCVSGTSTITLTEDVQDTLVTASDKACVYNGAAQGITLSVKGPSSYTIYYSTTTHLTDSNYTSGSTVAPTRTNSGTTTVYYYVKPVGNAYTAASGSAKIQISPDVDVIPFTGEYDGDSYEAYVTAQGNATVYYSTSVSLNFSNYKSKGTTTEPSRKAIGTTTVYYFAVPKSGATEETCVSGNTTITIKPQSVAVKTLTSKNGYITVQWEKASLADSYHIYRKTGTGAWKKIANVSGVNTTSYKDSSTFTVGKTYTYAVSVCYGSMEGSYANGAKSIKYVLQKPGLTSVTPGNGKLVFRWGKVIGASGYYIYRKKGSAKSWSKVKKITSGSIVSYTDTNVANGTKYTYTVRAYYGTYTSSYNTTGLKYYYLSVPTGFGVSSSSKGQLKVSWKNLKGLGYQIYYSTSSVFATDKKQTKQINIRDKTWNYMDINGLTNKKKYYVKIRSVYTVGGVTYYSAWSSAKSVTTK